MSIERSSRRVAPSRLVRLAEELLDASVLCAIATTSPGGRPHINTAYFAWTRAFEVVWLSERRAKHSRNLRATPPVAIAVYDSHQSWGKPDRGIQLFGPAAEVLAATAIEAEAVYASRFPDYERSDPGAYRFYRFRPRRMKLFHEPDLGAGVFVTTKVGTGGQLTWERTERYVASS